MLALAIAAVLAGLLRGPVAPLKTAQEPVKPPISVAQLRQIAPSGKAGIIKALSQNSALLISQCKLTNQKRINQAVGQLVHETAGLRTLVEYGGTKRFNRIYSHTKRRVRRNLGNVRKGDGARYRGRGFIQLTGRRNYKTVGQQIGEPLEKHPHLAASPMIAIKATCAFWVSRKIRIKRTGKVYGLNYFADRDNIFMISKLINGCKKRRGKCIPNGMKDRRAKLKRARTAFAIGGKPPEVAGWRYSEDEYEIVNEDERLDDLQTNAPISAHDLHEQQLSERRLMEQR